MFAMGFLKRGGVSGISGKGSPLMAHMAIFLPSALRYLRKDSEVEGGVGGLGFAAAAMAFLTIFIGWATGDTTSSSGSIFDAARRPKLHMRTEPSIETGKRPESHPMSARASDSVMTGVVIGTETVGGTCCSMILTSENLRRIG